MTTDTQLSELQKKHASLEQAIDDESHRPSPDTIKVSDLKKQKLRIKEEITRLDVYA